MQCLYYESCYEKTGLRRVRPGPTQTGLFSHRKWLEAGNFIFRKKKDCTINVAKTKALISFVVTAKLICVFVLEYAKSRFSHDKALIKIRLLNYWADHNNSKFSDRQAQAQSDHVDCTVVKAV